MTVVRTMPTPSPATMTCDAQIIRLAEPAMERLITYTDACGFNAGDVDYSSTRLELTGPGRAKLGSERCQNQRFLTCGHDDISEEARRVASTCSDPILEAHLSATGIFGTASALDAVWRAARDAGDRPPDACGVEFDEPDPMPDPTMPPSVPEPTNNAGSTASGPRATCPSGHCCPGGRMTLRLGSYGKAYNVAIGDEGEERSIPCDVGPYQYGTVEIKCEWNRWGITSQQCSRSWFFR